MADGPWVWEIETDDGGQGHLYSISTIEKGNLRKVGYSI